MNWMTLIQALSTMSSIHLSNQSKKITENGAKASFSFSYEHDQKVDPSALLSKAKIALQEILNDRHVHHEKRTILQKIGRWNFACPYCGDSSVDFQKKRGNIYTDKFYYKCYNCGKYAGLERFLKDFQKKVLNIEESLYVKEAEEKTRKDVGTLDPSFLFDIEKLKKFAVKRSEIEEKFNLKKSEGSSILTYLKKRLQPNTEVFSWMLCENNFTYFT